MFAALAAIAALEGQWKPRADHITGTKGRVIVGLNAGAVAAGAYDLYSLCTPS